MSVNNSVRKDIDQLPGFSGFGGLGLVDNCLKMTVYVSRYQRNILFHARLTRVTELGHSCNQRISPVTPSRLKGIVLQSYSKVGSAESIVLSM